MKYLVIVTLLLAGCGSEEASDVAGSSNSIHTPTVEIKRRANRAECPGVGGIVVYSALDTDHNGILDRDDADLKKTVYCN